MCLLDGQPYPWLMSEILTDSNQMLARKIDAQEAELDQLRAQNERLREALKELVTFVGTWAKA